MIRILLWICSIAPVAAVISIYQTGDLGSKSPVPKWILGYGGVGLVLGLLIYGYKVMKTIGYKLTALSPSRGSSAELASSLMVVTASYMGIPVSVFEFLLKLYACKKEKLPHCSCGANFFNPPLKSLRHHLGINNPMYCRSCLWHWSGRRIQKRSMVATGKSMHFMGTRIFRRINSLCWVVLVLCLFTINCWLGIWWISF